MQQPGHAVVVAVDGSERAQLAADWASAEARRRFTPLHVVIVNDDPARREHFEKVVHRTARRLRDSAPALGITEEVRAGHPIGELARISGTSQLLVLGSRGLGDFAEALLGSVSTGVATHAAGPVVVVRGRAASGDGPVVVGMDGARGNRTVLRFAFEAAALRARDLLAVQVWREEGLLAAPLPAPDREEVQRRIEESLAEQLSEWTERHPEVRARGAAVRGHPVAALVDAARESPLLVVGDRGGGGFQGMFLGSVACGVLHHAHCPVAVLR